MCWQGLYRMAMSSCSSVRLFVCRQKRVLIEHLAGLSGPAVLAAVSGRSAAWSVWPVLDLLMAVMVYRVGGSNRTDLFINEFRGLFIRSYDLSV